MTRIIHLRALYQAAAVPAPSLCISIIASIIAAARADGSLSIRANQREEKQFKQKGERGARLVHAATNVRCSFRSLVFEEVHLQL